MVDNPAIGVRRHYDEPQLLRMPQHPVLTVPVYDDRGVRTVPGVADDRRTAARRSPTAST